MINEHTTFNEFFINFKTVNKNFLKEVESIMNTYFTNDSSELYESVLKKQLESLGFDSKHVTIKENYLNESNKTDKFYSVELVSLYNQQDYIYNLSFSSISGTFDLTSVSFYDKRTVSTEAVLYQSSYVNNDLLISACGYLLINDSFIGISFNPFEKESIYQNEAFICTLDEDLKVENIKPFQSKSITRKSPEKETLIDFITLTKQLKEISIEEAEQVLLFKKPLKVEQKEMLSLRYDSDMSQIEKLLYLYTFPDANNLKISYHKKFSNKIRNFFK